MKNETTFFWCQSTSQQSSKRLFSTVLKGPPLKLTGPGSCKGSSRNQWNCWNERLQCSIVISSKWYDRPTQTHSVYFQGEQPKRKRSGSVGSAGQRPNDGEGGSVILVPGRWGAFKLSLFTGWLWVVSGNSECMWLFIPSVFPGETEPRSSCSLNPWD